MSRRALISKCDRCGQPHGVKYVKRVPGLLISFWFFICYEKQEPVYILEEFVS